MGVVCCCAQDESGKSVEVGEVLPFEEDRGALVDAESVLSEKIRKAKEAQIVRGAANLVFETPDGPKTILFTKKPLGMDFDQKCPIIVKRLKRDGHAKQKGVAIGWVVVAIQGEDVRGKDFAPAFEMLKAAVESIDS